MTIPPKFRKTERSIMATYAFTDIIEGTGSVAYYAIKTYNDAAASGAFPKT